MFVLRFAISLLLALVGLAFVMTPVAENLAWHWFQSDVELRSSLVFQSIEGSLVGIWNDSRNTEQYRRLFDGVARDERVLAVGLCSAEGKLVVSSSQWPADVACPPALLSAKPRFTTLEPAKGPLLLASFQLPVAGPVKPQFVILHDLAFVRQREEEIRYYVIAFLAVVSSVAAAVTILIARVTLRSWLSRLRNTLSGLGERAPAPSLPRDFLPVVGEVRQMLRELKADQPHLDTIKVEWTPQTLRRLLAEELPDAEVIVVSNREPYIHERQEGGITVRRPASGLVTALEPITRACKGIWIAHGSGSADKESVDANDHVAVPPDHPEYTLRRIWLTASEEEEYYFGFANEGLWPLCHIVFVRPTFRDSDWRTYEAVNRRFAEAVAREARTPNPIVLVQDYHFALLPRYVRELLPDSTIVTFWHIPWPNPEVFSICPWRREILHGLLGSSVLGFHTQFHCQNFLASVDRFMESQIDRDQSAVTAGDHATLVRPYPISIAWPPEGLAAVPPAPACRVNLRRKYHLPEDIKIGVGVERFDYTKGIMDRFTAIRELLRACPEWRGRFAFIQAAAPSRARLPSYQANQHDTITLAEAINREFGEGDYRPIILAVRHHEPAEVFELFRAADFCVVSSLHDGMNLVAKEFVAARDDDRGVLILSTFAGASKELFEALLVNPYDAQGMASAMQRALVMPEEEQADRMRLMREMVRDHNVYYWAARMLLDAAHLRKRAHIERFIAEAARGGEPPPGAEGPHPPAARFAT